MISKYDVSKRKKLFQDLSHK